MRRYARTLRSTSRHGRRRQRVDGTQYRRRRALVTSQPPSRTCARRRTRRPRYTPTRNAMCARIAPGCRTWPVVAARASSTPCHSGDSTRERLQPARQLADREERAREQEQRQHAEPHDHRERQVGVLRDRERGDRRAERGRAQRRRPGSRARPTPTGSRRTSAATRRNAVAPSIVRIAVHNTNPP